MQSTVTAASAWCGKLESIFGTVALFSISSLISTIHIYIDFDVGKWYDITWRKTRLSFYIHKESLFKLSTSVHPLIKPLIIISKYMYQLPKAQTTCVNNHIYSQRTSLLWHQKLLFLKKLLLSALLKTVHLLCK